MSISFQNNLKRKKAKNRAKKITLKMRIDNAKALYQSRLAHMKVNQAFGLGKKHDKKKKDNSWLVRKFKDLFKRRVKK